MKRSLLQATEGLACPTLNQCQFESQIVKIWLLFNVAFRRDLYPGSMYITIWQVWSHSSSLVGMHVMWAQLRPDDNEKNRNIHDRHTYLIILPIPKSTLVNFWGSDEVIQTKTSALHNFCRWTIGPRTWTFKHRLLDYLTPDSRRKKQQWNRVAINRLTQQVP